MVVSPYSTHFVSQQNTSPLRSETSTDIGPSSRQLVSREDSAPENQAVSARPTIETNPSSALSATIYEPRAFIRLSANEEIQDEQTTRDAPDQFNKVQTFVQIQSFEDSPSLIDTFV